MCDYIRHGGDAEALLDRFREAVSQGSIRAATRAHRCAIRRHDDDERWKLVRVPSRDEGSLRRR